MSFIICINLINMPGSNTNNIWIEYTESLYKLYYDSFLILYIQNI